MSRVPDTEFDIWLQTGYQAGYWIPYPAAYWISGRIQNVISGRILDIRPEIEFDVRPHTGYQAGYWIRYAAAYWISGWILKFDIRPHTGYQTRTWIRCPAAYRISGQAGCWIFPSAGCLRPPDVHVQLMEKTQLFSSRWRMTSLKNVPFSSVNKSTVILQISRWKKIYESARQKIRELHPSKFNAPLPAAGTRADTISNKHCSKDVFAE